MTQCVINFLHVIPRGMGGNGTPILVMDARLGSTLSRTLRGQGLSGSCSATLPEALLETSQW